jgi:hypothetical protein
MIFEMLEALANRASLITQKKRELENRFRAEILEYRREERALLEDTLRSVEMLKSALEANALQIEAINALVDKADPKIQSEVVAALEADMAPP